MKSRQLLLILIMSFAREIYGARILSVSFVSSKSHKNVYEPLLHELAKRGHQVTIVTPIKSSNKIANVREVVTPGFEEMVAKGPNLFELKAMNISLNPFSSTVQFFAEICQRSYNNVPTMDLLDEKFDLVIISAVFNECAFGFVRKFNAPIIAVTTIPIPFWLSGPLGSPSPPSFVPNPFVSYTDQMTFQERAFNFISLLFLVAIQNFYYFPIMEEIYRENLNDPLLPSSTEIFKNVSLVLSNSHFILNSAGPSMPQIVDVGGMHCHPANPLPKDLADFISGTRKDDGFIYFSMGSELQAHKMPEKYRKLFVETFKKLKLKVLWKYETETMVDLPANVKLGKWLPQQDILGHPNLKLMIYHGGLLSTVEAVYAGVPTIGIPMFGDQNLNMKKSEASGFAISLDFATLSEESLIAAINKILENPKYKENAMHASKIFRDQPETPLQRGVFWTEYVLRHKGASHLRSSAADLNFFQYYSLDVITFLSFICIITTYLGFSLLKIIVRKCCCSSKSTKLDKKKNA